SKRGMYSLASAANRKNLPTSGNGHVHVIISIWGGSRPIAAFESILMMSSVSSPEEELSRTKEIHGPRVARWHRVAISVKRSSGDSLRFTSLPVLTLGRTRIQRRP